MEVKKELKVLLKDPLTPLQKGFECVYLDEPTFIWIDKLTVEVSS